MNSIAFIGGGNMACALIGGLVRAGRPPQHILVVEPLGAQRDKLVQAFNPAAVAGVMCARVPDLLAVDDEVVAIEHGSRREPGEVGDFGRDAVEDGAEQAVDDLLDIQGLTAEEAGKLIMKAREHWFAESAG